MSSVESHINLAVGNIQTALNNSAKKGNGDYGVSDRCLREAVGQLTKAREELRTLRAMINKLEGNL